MFNVRVANVIEMPEISNRIMEMLAEVETAYFKSDHYKKLSEKAAAINAPE